MCDVLVLHYLCLGMRIATRLVGIMFAVVVGVTAEIVAFSHGDEFRDVSWGNMEQGGVVR